MSQSIGSGVSTMATSQMNHGSRAWLVWWLAAFAFGYAFFQRLAPSAMVGDLMSEFAIGGTLIGTLSALYFYPYVLLQVPLGALMDQLGARRLLTVSLSIAAVGSLTFALAENVWMAYLGRLLIGTGSAVGFLGSLSLAGRWFPPHRFAFLAGLAMFFAMLCGMLGQAPLALFIESYGWRMSMVLAAGVAALLAGIIFLFVRDSPDGSIGTAKMSRDVWRNVGRGLARAARIPRVWQVALIAAAMSGPMLTIGGLWGTPFLMSAYDLPRPQAAFYVSLLFLGWAFGAPFWGWASDTIGRRKAVLVLNCTLLCVPLLALCFIADLPLAVTVALMVLLGFSGAAMSVTFALAREVTPVAIGGSVTGIVNSMTVFSGGLLQPLVGWRLDTLWNGTMIDGSRLYQAGDYRIAFLLVLAIALMGLALALCLRNGLRAGVNTETALDSPVASS